MLLSFVIGAILLLIIAYLVYDKMTRTDNNAELPNDKKTNTDTSTELTTDPDTSTELTTDPHFVAWVKCISSNDRGDDSLLDVDGGPYKDEWIACRSSGAPA